MTIELSLLAKDGSTKAHFEGEREVTLAWKGLYEPGDVLRVRCSQDLAHLVMKLDECLETSHVLLRGGQFDFPIPFGEAQRSYGKQRAFVGERHWGYVRLAEEQACTNWRNLALNAHDLSEHTLWEHGLEPVLFPHASSNVVCDDPQFIPRNAIDGIFETFLHGSWPYTSWSNRGQSNAWLRVDFGKPVEACDLRIYLRADFPHDSWWQAALLECSDGSSFQLNFEKTGRAQSFDLGGRVLEWVRLHSLTKSSDEGFTGLSQIEVWGREEH